MTVVVDASAALAWLVPSQATAAADAHLERHPGPRVAPAIFSWEVGNALLRLLVRRRIPENELPALLAEWAALNIRLSEPTSVDLILPFARLEKLSLFDASYLALAIELEAELASRDADLIAAARSHGLTVHDLRDA